MESEIRTVSKEQLALVAELGARLRTTPPGKYYLREGYYRPGEEEWQHIPPEFEAAYVKQGDDHEH